MTFTLADAAPDLLDACQTVLAYLDKLENACDENDPLKYIRRQMHKPLRDKLELAIRKALGNE